MGKKITMVLVSVIVLCVAMLLPLLTSDVQTAPGPEVETDEPIYPYWNWATDSVTNVTISGTDFSPTSSFNVTVCSLNHPEIVTDLVTTFGPGETTFSVDYDFPESHPVGTYMVEVCDLTYNKQVAVCHFGVWGLDQFYRIYNRGEQMEIRGGGVHPLSTVTIDIYYDEDGDLTTNDDQTQVDVPADWGAITDPTADDTGEFTCPVDIPGDAQISFQYGDGLWAVYFVNFTYDAWYGDTGLASDKASFEVSRDWYITWTTPSNPITKNRGQTVEFEFEVTKSAARAVTGLTELWLWQSSWAESYTISLEETDTGHYVGAWTIPTDAPPVTYDCLVTDLPVFTPNLGITENYVTVSLYLVITDFATCDSAGNNKPSFQRTEEVYAKFNATYQDGTAVTTGSAEVRIYHTIDVGTWITKAILTAEYNSTLERWITTTGYRIAKDDPLTEIPPPLEWKVELDHIYAEGNMAWGPASPLTVTMRSRVLVVRGLDDRIYYRTYNHSTASWGSWNVVPTGHTCDSPAGTVYDGKLYLIVRGMDGYSLWFGWVNLGDDSFHGWTRMSGATPSSPTLISNGDKLVLVVRGMDNGIYYRLYDCLLEEWGDWIRVPTGSTCDHPAAATLDNELHLVVRGTGATEVMWHGSVDITTEVFTGWMKLPGSTPSAPTLAASHTFDRLLLVVRGSNDRIYYNEYAFGWLGWTVLPTGATCDSPAVTVLDSWAMGDGLLETQIVVRGQTGTTMWHYSMTQFIPSPPPPEWALMNGATQSGPTLTS